MNLPILILAAGASTRMRGADKLLEDVQGAPCLQVMAKRALATGQPIVVTLPRLDHPRARCLDGLDVIQVTVPDANLGMSRSLQRGIAALPRAADGVMILPADMPEMPWALIKTALESTSRLAIIPLQDLLELDSGARMNTPGTSSDNWNWRFTREQVSPDLARQVHTLAGQAGRIPE